MIAFRVLVATVLLAGSGCQGKLGEGPGDDADGVEAEPSEPFEPAFNSPDGQPQLLPFWVRLARVAAVVGRPVEDPLFDTLRANRLALGDYEYASGVKPDRMWSPARMALWAKSLRPVCESDAMTARFPGLASSGPQRAEFATLAWGREVQENELAFDAFASLPESERYQTVCLGILSAAEFVIQ